MLEKLLLFIYAINEVPWNTEHGQYYCRFIAALYNKIETRILNIIIWIIYR